MKILVVPGAFLGVAMAPKMLGPPVAPKIHVKCKKMIIFV